MEYLIRCCREDDLPAIISLCQKHAEFEHCSYSPEGKQQLLKNAIFSKKPKLFCFVVESNELIIGYFTYTFDFSTWDAGIFLYLDCLYLEPEWRNLGIGRQIIKELKKTAVENNCVNIQWQTPTFNEKAIGFYNAIGARGMKKVRFSVNPNDILA